MKIQHNHFISSAIKYTFLVSLILILSNSYAQNQYKIIFKDDIAKQSTEAKIYLQKISKTAVVIYNATENSAIISTTTSIDNNILIGKLEKLKASVKSIDLVDNITNTSSTEKNTTTSPSQKEIEAKAAKSKQQQMEKQNKPVSTSPYKRY